ncbi:hypothetical protein Gogos_010361 [Gossypium gossypioides]|uniref:Uncharacterized protein n=1 Tax=Gossypium gossypioides TaxID=34282 RepID=A0A7J9BKZ2_GOSGO|nr:hypothetical protein [Gossypium gossypioides]
MRLSSGVEGIARIEIQKRLDLIQMNVQKELICMNRKLNIAITRIGNPYGHPNILAEFIAGQLKNRVSLRKAMKKPIELTKQADTKGIQIQIVGCYNDTRVGTVEVMLYGCFVDT